VLEVKDETISVASAFPGHQEGMILTVSDATHQFPSVFFFFFF